LTPRRSAFAPATKRTDNFCQRNAKTGIVFFDYDNFASRNDSSVDDNIDGFTNSMIQGNDGASAKLHEICHRHGGRTKHYLHSHGNAQDCFDIPDSARLLGSPSGYFSQSLKWRFILALPF
jgi:hypothetical protein